MGSAPSGASPYLGVRGGVAIQTVPSAPEEQWRGAATDLERESVVEVENQYVLTKPSRGLHGRLPYPDRASLRHAGGHRLCAHRHDSYLLASRHRRRRHRRHRASRGRKRATEHHAAKPSTSRAADRRQPDGVVAEAVSAMDGASSPCSCCHTRPALRRLRLNQTICAPCAMWPLRTRRTTRHYDPSGVE